MKINLDAVSVLLVALAVGAVLYGLGYPWLSLALAVGGAVALSRRAR